MKANKTDTNTTNKLFMLPISEISAGYMLDEMRHEMTVTLQNQTVLHFPWHRLPMCDSLMKKNRTYASME